MKLVCELIDDRLLRSVQLWAMLAQLPEYESARTVMAYSSMESEPDTDGLVARLDRDGKVLVLPRIVGDHIEPARVGAGTVAGTWGILEPDGDVVDRASIDLVIVPGVAFTTGGARLGHGKAYYDRFLVGLQASTVGACFDEQIVDALPMDAHDVWLDHVLHA